MPYRTLDPADSLHVGAELRAAYPSLSPLVLSFSRVRNGVGNRGLDPLRNRVLTRVRGALEASAPDALPRLVALNRGLVALGALPEIHPPKVQSGVLTVAHRSPFTIENDARDVAFLASLFDLMPVLAVDRDRVKMPVTLCLNNGACVGIPDGAPILVDTLGRPVDAIQDFARVSGTVHADTLRILLVALDVGVPDALPVERTIKRIANWLHSLTGARLDGHGIA